MVSAEEFIQGLTTSGLMTTEEVHAFLVTLPPLSEQPSVKQLAAELVRRNRLTKYQAGRIAMGRPQGLVLGKYIIQDKIGEGGMGEVFVAEHRRMKRPVVVKVLPASAISSQAAIHRFQREVEAAAQLSHPNIVTAFDADEEEGIHFLVMEYVEGEALGQLAARKGPFTVDLAVSCILQAAMGLDYAHAKGIIHRDIKPNNLLLDKTGVLKILDMGLARFDDGRGALPSGDPRLTQYDQIVGTLEYMSPEQADNSSLVDRRSDIYSLGCTLFGLLANRPLYQSASPIKTLLAHRLEAIPSLRAERPDVPESLDRIFQRMVAKLPEQRYQSMSEVVADLEQCVAELGVALPPSTAPLTGKRPGEPDTKVIDIPPTTELHRPELPKSETGSSGPRPPTPRTWPAVGIDLGTTYSALAWLDDAERPQVLSNLEGDKTTPSVVLVDGHDVVVGKEAVKAMATDMVNIAECAKRDLGRPAFHQRLSGREYPPEVVQAYVLNKLRVDAQRQIGEFRKVVITVPAYFDEVRRKATQDAGYIAGLEVLDIINEPIAAALAFGYQRGFDVVAAEPKRVLVYDLGGGTFDVTVMEIGGGEFVTLATDGDVQLGGRDWDQRLIDFVAEQFIRKHGVDPREDANDFGRLLRECEDAKRTLSLRHRATVACDSRGRAERIEVTRDTFEEITSDLLERTAFTTRQTLQTAGLEWPQIDYVLMVGGSTRMPAVRQLLRELSAQEPDASISPDEAVAQGAAIHAGFLLDRLAGRKPRIRVRNVNSHSLGIVGTDPKTKRRQTAVLIPRNTPLPAKAKRVFTTLKEGQKSIVANIVEGESKDPAECLPIGHCTVRDLPNELPAGTPIEIRFQYEENGRLRVGVILPGVSDLVTQEISREHNLSPKQLQDWRDSVCGQTN